MYYNSFDLRFKSKTGAAVCGETICFFLEAENCREAYFMLRYGEGEYDYRPMQRTGDDRFFISVTFEEAGVYFYRFRVVGDFGDRMLYRAPDGASTTEPPFDWQQTVCSKEYGTPDWIKGGVIYQIFPDRFYKAECALPAQYADRVYVDWNSEPCFAGGKHGYVINNDYFGGNLAGITEKLGYLQSLGVTAIYLNPIFEAHSNHRYNTADYRKIDPTLGTNEDFCTLCREAKKHGIGVILDGVFSHTGSDSIYFNKENRYDSVGAWNSPDSPYYSWYKFEPNGKYASWWGFETLPEVNEENESFCEYITGEGGVIDYWMGLGASGFRLDVADELPDSFIEKIRRAVKRSNPEGLLIGEVWEDASNKVSYSKQRRYLMGDELDSVMNYPFANEILRFVRNCGGVDFMNRVRQIIENYPPDTLHVLMNVLSTHDTERLITALSGEPAAGRDREWQYRCRLTNEQRRLGEQLVRLAAALQFTLPGVPSIYYGDEILTEGDRDPFNRASFKWDALEREKETVNFYKKLGVLRAVCPALKAGDFIPAQYDYNGVSYLRVCSEGELLVMVNPSSYEYDFWLPPAWENDVLLFGENNIADGRIKVPPRGFALMGRGEWTDECTWRLSRIE